MVTALRSLWSQEASLCKLTLAMDLKALLLRGRLFAKRQDIKYTKFIVRALEKQSLCVSDSVTGSGAATVCMTSYGKRVETVHLAIESIASGTVRPLRMILWLDDESVFSNLPIGLRRLKARGLEVRLTQNYGPHTKYFPYVEETMQLDRPLVIADDDVIYEKFWLAGLLAAHDRNSNVIWCYRAHTVKVSHDRVAPYKEWASCNSVASSMSHFATGVSGCIFPVRFLLHLRDAGPQFMLCCPKADDIWLHVNAVRAGIETQQIHSFQLNFPFLPGTQDDGLFRVNVGDKQNDVQISRTYTSQDIAALSNGSRVC